jgi:hypothetical protein
MKELFVPHEQALLLKELGFEVKSPYYYNPNGVLLMKSFECDDETESVNVKNIIEYWDGVIKDRIDTPTYSQAFSWFRKTHNLIGLVEGGYDNGKNIFTYTIWDDFKDDTHYDYFSTPEEAELDCLVKLIEIVKNKQIHIYKTAGEV